MTNEQIKIFIEDLEETILRLHYQLRHWEEEYDQFRKKPLLKNRAKFNDVFRRYTYYKGKFYAYYYVLEKLGSDFPNVLKRLRGIGMNSGEIWETKMHYTEVYGHFPTESSKKLKVKK